MKKRLTVFLTLVVASLVIGYMWFSEGLRSVVPGSTVTKVFTIEPGTTLRDIADDLESQGLVRSKLIFFLYVRSSSFSQRIQAGTYRLSPAMDARTIAATLTKGTNDVWITTLEGWRLDEIATKITKELSIPEREFLKFAQEGYMFPETYLIPRSATASAIAKLFRETFEKKLTSDLREYSKRQNLSVDEVVTLASVVEREGKSDSDRPMIAGILLKRLRAGWPLQADATLQYALGYQSVDKTWWKPVLTEEDKLIDSPYNTYKHPGLPPGPISNPGLAAIKAVIYPKTSEYWYYLHTPNGKVYYAKTIEEHQANVEKYLR